MVYVKDNNMISRRAMGCRLDMGDLYDAVNDRCLQSSVLRNVGGELLKKYLKSSSLNLRRLRHFTVGTNSDILNSLGINSEQQASILAGQITPGGACEILKGECDGEKVLLKLSVRNNVTRLDVSEAEILKLVTESEIEKGATHLVVGIVYGWDVIISSSPTNCDNDAEKYKLLAVFELFEEALEEGNARTYISNEIENASAIAVKLFSDIDRKDLPNFVDSNGPNQVRSSLKLICELQSSTLNLPQVYLMLPISFFFEKSGKLFPPTKGLRYIKPSSKRIRESLMIYEALNAAMEALGNFEKLVDSFGCHVFPDDAFDEIAAYRRDTKSSLTKHKQRFKKWLVNAKTKANIQNFQLVDSEYTPEKIGILLEKYTAEISKMRWISEVRSKGISFLQNRHQFMLDISSSDEVFLFKYDSIVYGTTVWNEAYHKFLKLVTEKNVFESTEKMPNSLNFEPGKTSYIIFENNDGSQSRMGNLFEEARDDEKTVCTVEYYLDGLLVNGEVLDLFIPNTCKWDSRYPLERERFNFPSSAVVTMPCPGFDMRRCNEKKNIKWICEGCGHCLQFDFEGNFFCECGLGPIDRCAFKCNSLRTGAHYVKPLKGPFLNYLKTYLKPRKEINLLVMGETGVGKTTFINAFANYLTYSTLEEAEASDLIALIPSSFTITGADFQTKRVTVGNDDSEIREVGASQTQFCKCYTFPSDDRVVRIIDTPGIGDTRGVSHDEANFENILRFISNYPSIQGILLLLKPNNSRLSIFFRFCIQQLLCHLHKSASDNIVFVYTNARGTFYRPGDTHPPLKTLLFGIEQREPYVKIRLERPTIYCLDNESFRFLVALKNDIKFSKDHRQNFSDSWVQSVTECKRLFDYVSNLRPHKVTETISLNQVRSLILTLAKPLGDISQNIQLNISNLEDQQKKINYAKDDISNLKKVLFVPIVDLEPVAFEHPRTVCTAPNCVKIYNVDGITKVDYQQICHPRCYLENVEPDVINNAALMNCAAMGGTRKNCVVCEDKCPYEKHMHIYYENKHVTVKKVDHTIEKEIKDKTKRVQVVSKTIANLQDRVERLKVEQKEIMKLSAKFGQFLRRSAITPYNDALKDYMEYLISVEEQKSAADPSKKALVDELKQMKVEYENEIRIIQSNTAGDSSQPGNIAVDQMTLEDIKNDVNRLFQLPINGATINRMVNFMGKGNQREHAEVAEKIYRPKMLSGPKSSRNKKVGAIKTMMNKVQNFLGF